jgi:hypothetical protein
MISHAKISRHRRMFKTLTGLSMEGFKQILPFHHRRSGVPYPARSRLWIPSPSAVFIESTIYCIRGTTKRPRFVLQPFSRGVDLHSWTRRRAVPGG